MELPKEMRFVLDPRTENRYEVYAYRELSNAELIAVVKTFAAGKKRRLGRKRVYQIYTQIGAHD